jgi:hypothetical protein
VRLLGTALLCGIATLVNPYGWRLHQHVISVLRNSYVMDHVAEFRSFDFHSAGAFNVELFLFVAIFSIALLLKQKAYAPAILGVAALHMSLFSARHFPVAALLLLPVAAGVFTRELKATRRLAGLLDYADRLRAIDRRVLGTVPLALVLIATVGGLKAVAGAGNIEFDAQVYPVDAAKFLERNNLEARVFASDQWGGYLIYRFAGRRRVFIDGRGDFYGQDFLRTYAEVADVQPTWNKVLKQYGVGLVLLPRDCALASMMQSSADWKRAYSDAVASIFERVN